MPMHKRLACRLIGDSFLSPLPRERRRNDDLNVMIFKEAPRSIEMQTIEYLTAGTIIQVPLSEIYAAREPDEIEHGEKVA